jgi:hypothetical protein
MGSEYSQTYNSFSGVDMLVMFGSVLIGEIQGLSYTVTREKAPLYTMGSADPRAFSRGKRGIAGSFIFLVFDRNALLHTMRGTDQGKFLANQYETDDDYFASSDLGTVTIPELATDPVAGTVGVQQTNNTQVNNQITSRKVIAFPRYHDQIRPFDIVILAANEYGHTAKMSIHNVEIMNCGSGMSIDDITTDESCTFVATKVTPWGAQAFINPQSGVIEDNSRNLAPAHGGRGQLT